MSPFHLCCPATGTAHDTEHSVRLLILLANSGPPPTTSSSGHEREIILILTSPFLAMVASHHWIRFPCSRSPGGLYQRAAMALWRQKPCAAVARAVTCRVAAEPEATGAARCNLRFGTGRQGTGSMGGRGRPTGMQARRHRRSASNSNPELRDNAGPPVTSPSCGRRGSRTPTCLERFRWPRPANRCHQARAIPCSGNLVLLADRFKPVLASSA